MSDRPGRRDDAEIEATLRELGADGLELLEPPPDVWDGIESAVRIEEEPEGRVVPLEPRRRRVRPMVLSGAAAVVVVIAGVAAYVATRDDPAAVVASATLAYDPDADGFDSLGAQAAADAELLIQGGRHQVQLVDAQLPRPEAGADLEAWLIRPDDQGNVADLVSLGLVDPADPGSLAVPPGYDPSLYAVVDISVEPRDGDPAHSGRSILRGILNDT